MGRAGDDYDNALVASFFATLKSELSATQPWPTRGAARTAVFDYLECWYNPQRRHSALGYLSPIEYERRWQLDQAAELDPVHSTGSSALLMMMVLSAHRAPCPDRTALTLAADRATLDRLGGASSHGSPKCRKNHSTAATSVDGALDT
jgi:hypothetical protein